MKVRVRFAPSPTGYLHVGNVRTALFNWLFARKQGGVFVLRIEDTDAERSEDQYEHQLISDLKWLGLDWDEGVIIGGEHGPYRQTDRLGLYQQKARDLLESEKAYYCFCTNDELEVERLQQQATGQPLQYSGKCRNIAPELARARVAGGEKATLRLKVRTGLTEFNDLVFGPIKVDTENIGDFILLRSDGTAQYNFACVIDDAAMQISHVIRGEGHISNTHRQVLLYEALEAEIPQFAHLSTILGPDGTKLSKRHGATSIKEFRDQGYLPEALVNYLALLGWTPERDGEEIQTPSMLTQSFDLSRVNVSPATFDTEKLKWVNRSHLKLVSPQDLGKQAEPFLQESGILPEDPTSEMREWAGDLAATLLKYVDTLQDFAEQASFLTQFDPEDQLKSATVREVLSIDGVPKVIEAVYRYLQCAGPIEDSDAYRDFAMAVKEASGQKGRPLFQSIRIALTASVSGPELDKIAPLIEKGSSFSLPRPILSLKERAERTWAIVQSETSQ